MESAWCRTRSGSFTSGWFLIAGRVALASVIGVRYLAIGTGDTDLYVFAGMLAVAVISIRVFLFRGVNCMTGIPPRRNGF